MEDKVIEWLENNMNKQGYFYYVQNPKVKSLIDCYWKFDDSHFAVFYREIIEEIIDNE